MATAALDGFTGVLLQPGDDGYDAARRVWNGAIDRCPAFIARCRTAADVAAAIRFGTRHGLPIAVRGGGHSIPGLSVCEGGLMIDLAMMKGITIDPAAGLARVQPGVLWRELDASTQQHALAVPGGEVSHTGVAGLTLGGGVGWLGRRYGLTCDSLLAAQLVTGRGDIVEIDEQSDPELLWGLRGGGGNFGVVTSFTFRLHTLGRVSGGLVAHPRDRALEVLRFFRSYAAESPDDLTLVAVFITTPEGHPAIGIGACYSGPAEEAERVIEPLREYGPPLIDRMAVMPYTVLQSMMDISAPF